MDGASFEHPVTMREAAVEPSADQGKATVYDKAMLTELEDFLGRDHLIRLLALLVVEIRVRFPAGSDDRIAIGQDARALLAASGSLGFRELSRCCSVIEQACQKGGDITVPLRDGRIAANRALAALAAMRVHE